MLKRRELLIRSGIGAAATLLAGANSWAAATPPNHQTGTLLVSSCVASRQFADAFNAARGDRLPVEWAYRSGSARLAELGSALAPTGGPGLAAARLEAPPQYLAGLVSRGDWEIVDMLLPRRTRLHESGLAATADRREFTAAGVALAQRDRLATASMSQQRSPGAASYIAFLYLI